MSLIDKISSERPVLIAGPTASGKSAYALEIAARLGGVIINGDAMQVFGNWRVLTARPSLAEEELAPHHLYGHVPGDAPYSVGAWLRDVRPLLASKARPIIVGGTGLYFSALTEGLSDIPPVPPAVRARGDALLAAEGLAALLASLDAATLARIDRNNPARVQRAWEVQQATGRGLAAWQDETPAPILPLDRVDTVLLTPDKDWLAKRIDRRLDAMLANGALIEAEENLARWDPAMPSAKAIGAAELVAHLRGEMSLKQARDATQIATRQYAKRQRTWFRSRMKAWNRLALP